jgi:hypothetical protein
MGSVGSSSEGEETGRDADNTAPATAGATKT